MIDYAGGADGIAVVSWNMQDRSLNVINAASMREFGQCIRQAINDEMVRGVIITSSRPEFVVGADLEMLIPPNDPNELLTLATTFNSVLRRMETSGKPFVAAINGMSLGGGFELCLACHYRIAADSPKIRIGLPEVKIGLLPGGGGTQRLPRLIGIRNAIPLLVEGKTLRPMDALRMGLVDEVVTIAELMPAANRWILHNTHNPTQPWDRKGFCIPGGEPMDVRAMAAFIQSTALAFEKTRGNYPAVQDVLACVYEGCSVDFDTGIKVEARYFKHVLRTPQARNMVRAFVSRRELERLSARPRHVTSKAYTKIGVLGGGLMGSGIAYVCGSADLKVVLLDTTIENAERGKAYSVHVLDKLIAKGQIEAAEREQVLSRIHPTTDYGDLNGCELVIEAVFEDRKIKADVTRKTQEKVGTSILFASNTSTLPITGLAESWGRPENFIGLHFFSPVDKMPLLEIIRGKQTSEECLAASLDFARQIRKTPIVVNDKRGFYTSRVVNVFLHEGFAMLGEGVAPALIENAGRLAGMPLGPLSLADEVQIELIYHITKQTKEDLGAAYRVRPGEDVIELMVEKLERLGKKSGKGFYDYPVGTRKRLWPELGKYFPICESQPSIQELITRFLYIQSLETVRIMEEGVVADPRDADIGSILGWGFPIGLGGTISHIDMVGLSPFVAEADRLKQTYGSRFEPPRLLRDKAIRRESFYVPAGERSTEQKVLSRHESLR